MSGARPRSGTLIVREGLIVYASEGVAALTGRPAQALLGRPYVDFVARADRARILDRYERRLRGEAVPREYELALALPDGGDRAVECHVDLDGRDVLVHLRDLSGAAERRARLEALAALGAAIQQERREEDVAARTREGLWGLGLASFLMRVEPEGARVAWVKAPAPLEEEFARRLGAPLAGYQGRWTPFARAAWDDGFGFTDDWGAVAASFLPPEHAEAVRSAVEAAGLPRAVAVRLDERGSARSYLVIAGAWLRADDLPAVRLFAAQIAAALDAARTIGDLSRRNADLAALNRIGELVGEAADLQTLFRRADAVLRDAVACAGLALFVLDEEDGALHLVYDSAGDAEVRARFARVPLDTPMGEVARERLARVVLAEDAPEARALLARLPFSTAAWVPLVARSRVVGVMAAGFDAPPPAVRARLDLLASVAAHFASAIESQGLLTDLRRRVSELTLLNDVALATAQLDPVLLLDNALRRVCETFGADGGSAFLRDGDRLDLATSYGISAATARTFGHLRVGEGLPGLAVQRLAPVRADDLGAADPVSLAVARAEQLSSAVAIPLLAKGETAVGALVLGRRAGRRVDDGELTLLSAVGAQLGVAVENARLFAEARRRLSELSTVIDVARVVSSSLDLEEVLESGAEHLARTLGAAGCTVLLEDPRSSTLRRAASSGVPLGPVAAPLSEPSLAREAREARAPVARRGPPAAGAAEAALLAVPLHVRDQPVGVALVAAGPERAFAPGELSRAMAIASQLAVAVDNARLYAEARRRAEELGLLHEVGRALVATLDIEEVLQAGAQNLARIVDAPAAVVALLTDDGGHLEIRAQSGGRPGLTGLRLPLAPPDASVATLVFDRREPVVVEDAASDPRLRLDPARHDGRAYVGLPLRVRDRCVGAAVIVDARAPRRFTAPEVERAAAIANQLAVAAENARLYEDLRRSYAQLAQAQRQLIQQERLAALGELSAVVAHEVRNPLGVIFNSLGSLRRLVRPHGDAKLLLDIMGEEADRLNRIVGDLLDFARPSTPELRPERLDRVVEEAVAAAIASSAGGVELAREHAPGLPEVRIDARLVRQAVLNVAVNAVQAMPRGGRLTVRTLREPRAALVELEDTGGGMPEEVRARIFEPFFTTKASGTGLGLAVVKRIMDGHGGEISVRSRPGAGTIFSLRFPVPSGEDAAAVETEGRHG